MPTAAEQVLLGISDRTAVLAIDRTGELRGQPVEWRQTLVRGDRFSLMTDLTRPNWMAADLTHPAGASGADR